MKLEDIFAKGHFVAVAPGPIRYVVRAPYAAATDGFWPVSGKTVDGVGYKKRVEPGDLDGSLSAADLTADTWNIDDGHCWCEECAASRKMLETQGDF